MNQIITLLESKKKDITVSTDEMKTIDKVIGWIRGAAIQSRKCICGNEFFPTASNNTNCGMCSQYKRTKLKKYL